MIIKAIKLAKKAHEGQTRRYTGEAYIMHPARVAMQVSLLHYATEEMIAAAWLHDVIEDSGYDHTSIIYEVGSTKIADLVQELTFNEAHWSGSTYAEKKHRQNQHIADASFEAKSIKILDRLDNLEDFARSVSVGDCPREKLERYIKTSWEMQDMLVRSNSKIGETPKVDDYLLAFFQAKLLKMNREFNLQGITL